MYRITSLAGQPYFSLFPVGGARAEGEKNFSLPLTPPTGNKEKYGWPARLGSNITQKVVAIGPAESWTSLKAWKLNPSTLIDSHVLALQDC